MNNIDQHVSLLEDVDYELVPVMGQVQKTGQDQLWQIRILNGIFVESVIQFGTLKLDDTGEFLNFDFEIIRSPDNELTIEDEGLQTHMGMILSNIIEKSVELQEV